MIIGPVIDEAQPIQTIGDADEAPITVPHALFKIVARDDPDSGLPRVLSFIYPQEHPSYGNTSCSPPYPHELFLVTLREVQDATGLTFFNDLSLTGSAAEDFLDARPAELWPLEPGVFGLTC